jgi:uncharacterized membrane protein
LKKHLFFFSILLLCHAPSLIHAEFRVCNKTPSRIGIAVGVLQDPIRITQGWFNIKPNVCETPIKEDLKQGPYFIYAIDYDRGGEWGGTELLCVKDREFYIEGSVDCYARGFERVGFHSITTKGLKNWTLDINDPQTTLISNPVKQPK